MKSVTIKQLAEDLKLSKSTVSRALSDSYEVSEATKERVKQYAIDRNDTLNSYASGLRKGRTYTIGVVICSLDNAFMVQVINGFYDSCHEEGYLLLIMQSQGDYQKEMACVKRLVEKGVDGMLISPSFNSQDLSYLSKLKLKGFPLVLFDRVSNIVKTHQVAIDNFVGADNGAAYILSKGYRKVLVLGCVKDVHISRKRLDGFISRMEQEVHNDISIQVEQYDPSDVKALATHFNQLCQNILRDGIDIDVVFSTTDTFTIGFLQAMERNGLIVPLVGFCNNELSDIFIGRPTTLIQPARELGLIAFQKLLSLIKFPDSQDFETIYLFPQLVSRDR